MAIIDIKIGAAEAFAEGQPFSKAGSYLRIKGIAKGELDPAAPENRVIADLDKAPRNARGIIEYETDFFILRPVEPRRTNGVLVYDVTNRGRKMIFNLLDDARSDADTNDPKTARDLGLAFTLGRGYSLVLSVMRAAENSPARPSSSIAAKSTLCWRSPSDICASRRESGNARTVTRA